MAKVALTETQIKLLIDYWDDVVKGFGDGMDQLWTIMKPGIDAIMEPIHRQHGKQALGDLKRAKAPLPGQIAA